MMASHFTSGRKERTHSTGRRPISVGSKNQPRASRVGCSLRNTRPQWRLRCPQKSVSCTQMTVAWPGLALVEAAVISRRRRAHYSVS